MLPEQSGLMEEVKQLHSAQMSAGVDVDYSRGICQAIGYKPFATYLQHASPTQQDFEAAVEQTKIQTRQYAKRQINWFKGKLLPAVQQIQSEEPKRDVEVFILDASDAEKFEENVEDKAIGLLESEPVAAHPCITVLNFKFFAAEFLANEAMPQALDICPSASELFEISKQCAVSLFF